MRCWRKSTTWRASALAAAAVTLSCWWAPVRADDAVPESGSVDTVRHAIAAAIRARMGPEVEVLVEQIEVHGDLGVTNAVTAVVDPSARVGARMRVALRGHRGRTRSPKLAEASCVIRLRGAHYEVVRPLSKGDPVAPDAVRRVDGWVTDISIRPLATTVAGARAARALEPGAIVARHDLALPPSVQSGEVVRVRLTDGPVEVALEAVAMQDGDVGDAIQLVNPSSGRRLRGRVVGPGKVEVNNGT